jgi:hypothetical protein
MRFSILRTEPDRLVLVLKLHQYRPVRSHLRPAIGRACSKVDSLFVK